MNGKLAFHALQQNLANFHGAQVLPQKPTGLGKGASKRSVITKLLDGATESQICAQVRELRTRAHFANHVRYNLRIIESLVTQADAYKGEAATLQVNTFYAAVVVGQSPAPHHIVWSSCVVRIGASHHTESPLPEKTERSAGWCARDG